jgi:serine protease inhibitor
VPTVVSALVEEPEAKIFNADHPFIFYVKVKGVVLFGGRVVEPKL